MKGDRFMLLMRKIRAMPAKDRKQMIAIGKRDRSARLRLFFHGLEKELRRRRSSENG